ncbi:hypothetical protein J3458_002263 [Metarhizium acridum]|uniref:uncharacterized protein n=1 Tax=Metarhizium acridum TaxID=92637 RepID=UPI001C6B3D21|nr:hypothetical protein J3458_002263 [Metarhizium acridum]
MRMMRMIWEEKTSKPSYRAVMKLRLESGMEYNKTQDQTMALASGSSASRWCQPGTRNNVSVFQCWAECGSYHGSHAGHHYYGMERKGPSERGIRGDGCRLQQAGLRGCPINIWTKNQKPGIEESLFRNSSPMRRKSTEDEKETSANRVRSWGAEYQVAGATESNKEKQVVLANMTDENLRRQAALGDSGRVLCTEQG